MTNTVGSITRVNADEIKRRSFIGVIAYTSRTFILQVIGLIATFILTVLLDPTTFGIFYVVTAVVNFLNYFSDIGLAAALIQQKDEPEDTDYATTFTIQQILVGCAVILTLLGSVYIARFYKLGNNGLFLLRALIVSFFLSSLKTIPSVKLERKLDFKKLVIPQIVESLVFYITAIFLAFSKMGVVSFAWAALARGFSGLIVLYIIAPWRIHLLINIQKAKKLLSFGIPYQANSFIALLKDDLLTVFLGKVLPFAAIGYIGWAKKWAEVALRLIMDNIIKVTFPVYSRLQHDKEYLTKALNKSLLFLSILTLPIAIGMMFMIKPFIQVVPRYIKWEPALFSFYLFTISSVMAAISSPLVNTLNALGKVKYTFYLMLLWTSLTWILVPILIHFIGFNGVALSAVIIGTTSFMPIVFVNRIVKINLFKIVYKPVIATIFMSMTLFVITASAPTPATKLIFGAVSGGGVYLLFTWVLLKDDVLPYLNILRNKN